MMKIVINGIPIYYYWCIYCGKIELTGFPSSPGSPCEIEIKKQVAWNHFGLLKMKQIYIYEILEYKKICSLLTGSPSAPGGP